MSHPLLPRPGERLLPAVSGLLLAASFPPLHPLVLPFVALVPLAVWVQALPPHREGSRAAARGGAVFGAVHFGLLLYWIAVALVRFTPLALLAWLGATAVLAALAALVAWALHRGVHGAGAPLWLALPVVWTAGEWFRAHWPGPLAFPWLGLGTSLTGFPQVVGMAEVVGERGVGFWIALAGGLGATLVAPGRRARAPVAAALALTVLLPAGWGVWRARTMELHVLARVAVVQPDVPVDIKRDPELALDSTLASLDRLLPGIVPGSVSLVVLPEVTFPVTPGTRDAQRAMEWTQAWAREVGAPVLFGSLGRGGGAGGALPYNSAFLMEPGGLAPYRYDKRHLVPVVERTPLLPDAWSARFDGFGGYGEGVGWPLAEVDGLRYGVLICYESSYAEASRAFLREGADVLVNITNDAWYGREPLWTRTTALWQHPAHLVMRAIETRTGVARAANTGISLFVDPVGRVTAATPLFEPTVLVGEVSSAGVTTAYVRYGDVVGTGAAAAALLLLVVAWARDRRRPRSLDPEAPGH